MLILQLKGLRNRLNDLPEVTPIVDGEVGLEYGPLNMLLV